MAFYLRYFSSDVTQYVLSNIECNLIQKLPTGWGGLGWGDIGCFKTFYHLDFLHCSFLSLFLRIKRERKERKERENTQLFPTPLRAF